MIKEASGEKHKLTLQLLKQVLNTPDSNYCVLKAKTLTDKRQKAMIQRNNGGESFPIFVFITNFMEIFSELFRVSSDELNHFHSDFFAERVFSSSLLFGQ